MLCVDFESNSSLIIPVPYIPTNIPTTLIQFVRNILNLIFIDTFYIKAGCLTIEMQQPAHCFVFKTKNFF